MITEDQLIELFIKACKSPKSHIHKNRPVKESINYNVKWGDKHKFEMVLWVNSDRPSYLTCYPMNDMFQIEVKESDIEKMIEAFNGTGGANDYLRALAEL